MEKIFSSIYWHPILAKALVAILCLAGAIWVVFEYVNPAPPPTITMATGFRGGAYEYFGKQYQERLARAHASSAADGWHVGQSQAAAGSEVRCRYRLGAERCLE